MPSWAEVLGGLGGDDNDSGEGAGRSGLLSTIADAGHEEGDGEEIGPDGKKKKKKMDYKKFLSGIGDNAGQAPAEPTDADAGRGIGAVAASLLKFI